MAAASTTHIHLDRADQFECRVYEHELHNPEHEYVSVDVSCGGTGAVLYLTDEQAADVIRKVQVVLRERRRRRQSEPVEVEG